MKSLYRHLGMTVVLLIVIGSSSGCLHEIEEESTDSSFSGSDSGSSLDPLEDYSQVNYSYSCPLSSSTNDVLVVDGPCKSQQEYFARTFGCNVVEDFYDACTDFWGCAVNNSSSDSSFIEGYQTKLDECEMYR